MNALLKNMFLCCAFLLLVSQERLHAVSNIVVIYNADSKNVQYEKNKNYELDNGMLRAQTNKSEAGYLVFGAQREYRKNIPYVATFTLMATNPSDKVATIDVYDQISDKIIMSNDIGRNELADGKDSIIRIGFLPTAKNRLEIRLYWHKKSDLIFKKIDVSEVVEENFFPTKVPMRFNGGKPMGNSLLVEVNDPAQPRHIVYGPYIHLRSVSPRVVSFALCAKKSDKQIAILEVYDAHHDTSLANKNVNGDMFSEDGCQLFDLDFKANPNSTIEFRIWWHAKSDLMVKEIRLFSPYVYADEELINFALTDFIFGGNHRFEIEIKPDTAWERNQKTQSFIYMPLILGALHQAAFINNKQINPDSISKKIDEMNYRLPGIFNLIRNIIAYNLKNDAGSKFISEDVFVDGNGENYEFDIKEHMSGEHQEKFLDRYLSLGRIADINDFLNNYPIDNAQMIEILKKIYAEAKNDNYLASLYFVSILNEIIYLINNRK